jgi:hypothetical protein
VIATFRALTTIVRVELDDDAPYAALVRALIAPYSASSETPEISYCLHTTAFSRTGADDRVVEDPRDVVPLFEIDLYEQVIARASPGWLLHASAIEARDGALVLAGPSGAGKTTMTLALAARGYRIQTEEIVWINSTGEVRGLPRALHVRDRSVVPTGWSATDYPLRPSSRNSDEQVLVVPPASAIAHGALPIHAIVRLTHGSDRRGGLERLAAHEAITKFWDSTLRQDDDGLAAATAVLRATPAYRLASTSFADAAHAIEGVLGERK